MTPEELKKFRDDVAAPAMQKLLDSANLEDGMCFIEKISLSYIDGRSWGHDCAFEAEGLLYNAGKAQEFKIGVEDVDFDVFLNMLKDYQFLLGAEVLIYDELNEAEVKTSFRSVNVFAPVYADVQALREMPCCSETPEYLKLKKMFQAFGNDFLVSFEGEPNKQFKLSELDVDVLCKLCEEIDIMLNESFNEAHFNPFYDSNFLITRVDEENVDPRMLIETYGDELSQLRNQVLRVIEQKASMKNASLESQINEADKQKGSLLRKDVLKEFER